MPRIRELLDLLRRARALEEIPPVHEFDRFRHWVKQAAALVDDVGDHTEDEADDHGGQVLAAIVASDDAWRTFYRELLLYVQDSTMPLLVQLEEAAQSAQQRLRDVVHVWMVLAGCVGLDNDQRRREP